MYRTRLIALFMVLLLVAHIIPPAQAAIILDERAAEAEEWGYRPDNGATVDINPPAFSWRPAKEAISYELQIAADNVFSSLVYTVEKLPLSAHCPHHVLNPGTYFWRYRGCAKDGATSNWSAVRQFMVPDNLASFPMPSPDDLIHRIPQCHPRLFFGGEEAEHLKALSHDSLQERWSALLKQAEKLLNNPPDLSDPPRYPEGTERKGEQWKRIWWGNRVRAIAVADGAATLAFAYRIGGDARHGEAARRFLLSLCDWDPKGATNYDYNDEAAMPLLYYPARAYTWAFDMFSEEERTRIVAMMRVRGEDCYNSLRRREHLWRPYSSHHNRAWHKLGELATVFIDVIPEAPAWLEYCMTIFYTCYPVWGDSDGGWHEGQAYWLSYLNRFMYWALTMQYPYGINVFEKTFFRHVGDYGLYTCPPGTKTGAFGDLASGASSEKIATLMGLMAAVADNPYWRWYADQHGAPQPEGYFGYLLAAQQNQGQAAAPDELPSSKVFHGTGLAALNTNLLDGRDNIQVHFKSSPFGTQSHSYNANNSFLLNLKGERVLIWSGQRDIYGSPHHKDWMWQTKSDNAILVNNLGQYSHSPRAQGRISDFYTSPTLDVVVGEAGDSYDNLTRWTRRFLFFKPNVILIHDVLEALAPSTYQWLLHAQAPFVLSDTAVSLSTEVGNLDIAFLKPQGLAISQTDEFDPPPHDWANLKLNQWHLKASHDSPEAFLEFIVVLRINGFVCDPILEENPEGAWVRLLMPANDVNVLLKKESFDIKMGAIDLKM